MQQGEDRQKTEKPYPFFFFQFLCCSQAFILRVHDICFGWLENCKWIKTLGFFTFCVHHGSALHGSLSKMEASELT